MYKNADDIPGHHLSGSGKLVPFQQGAFAPHAQKYVVTSKTGGYAGTEAENYYNIPGQIYCNQAGKYGIINYSGSQAIEFEFEAKKFYPLQPTAWTGSEANGSLIFIYNDPGS